MNALVLAQHARAGLGALGSDFDLPPLSLPPLPNPGVANPVSYGGGFDWNTFANSALGAGTNILGSWFQSRAVQSAGWPQGAGYQQPGGYTPEQIAAIQAAQLAAARGAAYDYGSVGVTGAGVRIGNTTIGWPVIAGGALIIYLVQRPGFTRRR